MKRSIVVALCIAVALAGCSKSAPGGDAGTGARHPWTKPHVLTYGDPEDVSTLNAHLSSFADTQYIAQMTAAWLVRWDQQNTAVPELATEIPTKANGGVSADGLTITYHLRHGVKWSDGAPFDADDVVFSTHVVLNKANNETSTQGWDRITKIDEPDKFTVVYHLSKPYSPFVETFFSTASANPCLLPKHLLAQYPNINNVPYNNKPVGIGPFVVDRWDRGSQVVMKANPLYWRGRPKLDEVIFKIIPDRNTLLSQLQSHEIDLWPLVSGAYLAQTQAIAGVTVARLPSYYWNHFDLNTSRPVLSDPVVRRALRMATDRATIREKLGHGLGSLAEAPTPLTAPYAVHGVPLVPYDAAQAAKTLDDDGWKVGADGVRAKNGVRLVLTWASTTGTPDVDNQIELVRTMWQKIGVTITEKKFPAALMFAPDGTLAKGNWDVASYAWLNEAIGDYSPIYGCDSLPPNGQNYPRWCNQAAQAAMTALYSHYDQAQRNADVATFVKQFVQDTPVILYTMREDVYAYNSDLKNFHPNGLSQFDNMMNVDI